MSDDDKATSFLMKYFIAVRPFAYTVSISAVALGVAIAYAHTGIVLWGRLFITLLGVLSFHTAANLFNDYFDYKRGLDKIPLPNSGAIVRGLLSAKQVFIMGVVAFIVGCVCGGVLVFLAGRVVLLLGILGAGFTIGYTTPRFCFKYARLGDIAIFFAFGVLPVFGTYWVQVQSFHLAPVAWSIPISLWTVAILHANNWRDIDTDLKNNCYTVANWLGYDKSKIYYKCLILGSYLIAFILFIKGDKSIAPVFTLLSLLTFPLIKHLFRIDSEKGLVKLDERTAKTQSVFAFSLILGWVLDRFMCF